MAGVAYIAEAVYPTLTIGYQPDGGEQQALFPEGTPLN